MANGSGILALLANLGTGEIVVILIIALIVFGRRLPEVGRTVGKTLGEFRRSVDQVTRQISLSDSEPPEHKDDDPPPVG